MITGLLSAHDGAFGLLPAYDFLWDAAPDSPPESCGSFEAPGRVPTRVWALALDAAPSHTGGMRRPIVYLLGPPTGDAYSNLWCVGSTARIYARHDGFNEDDRDMWFGGAVTTFVTVFLQSRCTTGAGLESCVAWCCTTLHVHGSINVLALWFLRGFSSEETRPTVIYTLHDYLGEPYRFFSALMLAKGPLRHVRRRTMELAATSKTAFAESFVEDADDCLARSRGDGSCNLTGISLSWPSAVSARPVTGSLIGIRFSDAVTTVSGGMLSAMIDVFGLVPTDVSIALRQAVVDGSALAIQNGVDSSLDPFLAHVAPSTITGPPDATARLDSVAIARIDDCGALFLPHSHAWRNPPSRELAQMTWGRKQAAKNKLCTDGVIDFCDELSGVYPIVILFVGRFESNKGFHLLPGIIRSVCTETSGEAPHYGTVTPVTPVQFLLLGSVSEGANDMNDILDDITSLQRNELAGGDRSCSVRVLSAPNDVAAWEQDARMSADIGLVLSQREAFGIVIAEALAHGALVVALAVGGVPDTLVPEPIHFMRATAACEGSSGGSDTITRFPCEPSVLLQREKLRQRQDITRGFLSNGYLVPPPSTNFSLVAAACADATMRAIAAISSMLPETRKMSVLRCVQSAPRWAVPFDMYRCVHDIANRARAYPRSAAMGMMTATQISRSSSDGASWGPELMPQLSGDACGSAQLRGWSPLGRGFSTIVVLSAAGRRLFIAAAPTPPHPSLSSAANADRSGLITNVYFHEPVQVPLFASALSRSLSAVSSGLGSYCVWIDAYFKDGSTSYGLTAGFAAGTHEWVERGVSVLARGGGIVQITFALIGPDSGEAEFAEPSLRLRFDA